VADTAAADGRALTTMWPRAPSRHCRAVERKRRLTRLRITAFPTVFATTKPKRGAVASITSTYTTTEPCWLLCPRRVTLRNNAGEESRCARSSTGTTRRRVRCDPCDGEHRGCAAGTSTHAKTEAVNLGATAVVWLERSLAHNSISMKLIARSEGARRKTTRCSVASTD
jgi:hypothetical protein